MERNKKTTIWTKGFIYVLIANVGVSLAQFSVNTYVSSYMGYLGMSAVLTGIVAGIYFGVAFALRPVSGPAVTMLNRKNLMIYVFGAGIFINLGYAFFPSVPLFITMRVLHGVQLAFMGSLSMTVATEFLPEEKMATGLGIYGLSYIVAQAFGPSLGSFLQSAGDAYWGTGGGFRAIFLAAAAFAVLSTIPCILLPYKEPSRDALRSLGPWYKNIVAVEALSPSTVMMLMSMASVLIHTYMIPYGTWKGINNIALYFTVSAAVTLLTRPIAGRLTDRFGPAKVFYPGMLLTMSSYLLISYATDLRFIVLAAVCASVGNGTVFPAIQTMTIQSVSPLKRGVASNTNFLGIDLGSFIGPTLSGFIVSRFDFSTMYRMAIIPILLSMLVFALGWKPYLRQRERLEKEDMDSHHHTIRPQRS